MRDAAKLLGVTSHAIRRAIQAGILPAIQVVADAPYQIRSSDLQTQAVMSAIARKGRPCRPNPDDQIPMFPNT